MQNVKLFGYSTSPFVRKTGCCLYYKEIPFEFVPVNPVFNQEIEFTEQTQVPVLQVGEEWKLDSVTQAEWLDELFPDKPLLGENEAERERILALDKWINDNVIHGGFRSIHDKRSSANSTQFRHIAWRLAAIVSSQTPLSEEIRNAWPEILKQAPFIKRIAKESEEQEKEQGKPMDPATFMLENLGEDGYLGGFNTPSLADFSAYQVFVFNYAVGISSEIAIEKHDRLKQWIDDVKIHLPANPLLVPDYIIVNSLI